MISVLKSMTAAVEDIKKQYDQFLGPSISQLSKGIDSFPDELLAIVFEDAVREEGAGGVTMAKLLSHVSRRFRNVALANRSIWATLRSNGSMEEWQTFISRSGSSTDFHVFIQTTQLRNRQKWDAFMDRCWQTASRWTSLTLTRLAPDPCPPSPHYSPDPYETEPEYDYAEHMDRHRVRVMKNDMEFIVKAFNGGDRLVHTWRFPRLFELDVQCGDLKTKLLWKSPKLQVLRYLGDLPKPSAVFSSVTTFHYEITSSSVCCELLKLIASMPNITSLHLTLPSTILKEDVEEPRYFPPSFLNPPVTFFRLLIPNFPFSTSQNGERFIVAFLHALRIPNMEHFSVQVGCKLTGAINRKTEALDGLSRALLPVYISEPLSRPSSVNFKIVKNGLCDRDPFKVPSWIFPIPLERIPAVSTLTFSTCTRVIFTREDHVGADIRREPCLLREIRFSGCEQMEIEDLHLTVRSLKHAEAWDTLERIVVENCDLLEYESALEVVGMERLCYPA